MKKDRHNSKNAKTSATFKIGAIAITFLIIGFQTALFIHKATITKIISDQTPPDTVFIEKITASAEASSTSLKASAHASQKHRNFKKVNKSINKIKNTYGKRSYAKFKFNPNNVTIDQLCKLGFSNKQADAIDKYRKAGGRFCRKTDFAKSFVVPDTVYKRLEPYIHIPLIDLNTADSAALKTLPGIGNYFANKIIQYRERLHGYSYKEQLMDIYRFDKTKYDKISDLIDLPDSSITPYPLWTLPEDSLTKHPYIQKYAAHGIILFRENSPSEQCTIDNLIKAGIIRNEYAEKLRKCLIIPHKHIVKSI